MTKLYALGQWLGDRVIEFLAHSDVGARFVFGDDLDDHRFAFQVLPVVVFFRFVYILFMGVSGGEDLGWKCCPEENFEKCKKKKKKKKKKTKKKTKEKRSNGEDVLQEK